MDDITQMPCHQIRFAAIWTSGESGHYSTDEFWNRRFGFSDAEAAMVKSKKPSDGWSA